MSSAACCARLVKPEERSCLDAADEAVPYGPEVVVLVLDADEGTIEVARVGGFGPRPWIEPGATSAR